MTLQPDVRDLTRSLQAWLIRLGFGIDVAKDIRRAEAGPLFHYMGGCGASEVLVESPEHEQFIGQPRWVTKTLRCEFR